MKLNKLQNNAIQVSIDTCIQNLYELRDVFESPHDLETHSFWTLNLLYEYLTSETEVIKEVIEDEEKSLNPYKKTIEDYQSQYVAMVDALKKIKQTIKIKGINKSSIDHTIQCLRDIINGDASVHNMGGLSDYLLENAFIIDDGNPNHVSRKKMIIESCLRLIDVLNDEKIELWIKRQKHYEEIEETLKIMELEGELRKKYNLDYRVVDWLIGCTKVQEELSNE